MAMPSGLGKVFASEAKQAETSDVVDIDAARIKGHRVLGTGKAAFEVSALGFGVMGMTYNRSQHPDKKECIRLLHEAVERGVTLFDRRQRNWSSGQPSGNHPPLLRGVTSPIETRFTADVLPAPCRPEYSGRGGSGYHCRLDQGR